MSLKNFFNDVFHGNFSNAWTRFTDFLGHDVEPALEAWVKKFLTDEGKLLLSNALTFAQEVSSGKSIKDAGSELVSQMASQGVAVAENDALDAIRTQLSHL